MEIVSATRDDEITKGEKIVEDMRRKKEVKKLRISEKASRGSRISAPTNSLATQLREKRDKKKNVMNSRPQRKTLDIDQDDSNQLTPKQSSSLKSFAAKTIWGQNIINCRSFNIDSVKNFEFVASYTSATSIPIYPIPEIAFLGRSNVGKSSMLNCLTGLNKKIAVESKTPGRTQCINLFKCSDKEGDICLFVDLPGYGFAKMSKAQQEEVSTFLRQYLSERGSLRLAVLLVDARREPQTSDRDMINFLLGEGLPFIVVATKCDKLNGNCGGGGASFVSGGDEASKSLSALREAFDLPSNQPVAFSSITGLGRRDILRAIRSGIVGEGEEEGEESGEDSLYYGDNDE